MTAAPPHRLVRASAGSGKTFQLTNGLLALLLRGEEPSAILATTFTKAAAGEILHRTLARLSAAALEEKALREVREHCDAGATHESCAAALGRVVSSLDRLSVLTIDAFFSRLAGAHALEIGLAPGWRVVSEEEEEGLRATAAARALASASEDERLALLAQLQGDELRQQAHSALMRVVGEGYEAFLATDGDAAAWEAVAPSGRGLSADELREALGVMRGLSVPTTARGEPRKNYASALEKIVAAVEADDAEAFLAASKLVKCCLRGEEKFDRIVIPDDWREAISPLLEHAARRLTAEHLLRTRAARRLLERFDLAYTELKRERGAATFADPPRLLRRGLAGGSLETMYYRLDGRVRHVLLDEFQDTSMSQFELLEPMLDELLSQADGRSVFCVGDVKQSLYSWRGAEPELLPALEGRWPAFGGSETFSVSWRSAQPVLDAVNETFSRLDEHPSLALDESEGPAKLAMQEAARESAAEWREWFAEGRHVSAKPETPGYARLSVAVEASDLAADDGTLSTTDANRAALQTVVDRVLEIRREAPEASIGVIVRTGAQLRSVLHRLKQAPGVDASEERGSPLADSPVVAAAVSLLRMIDHPGDTAARHHVASTPLGQFVGLSSSRDDAAARRIARGLRSRVADRGLSEVLLEWKRETAHAMEDRGAARFDQLIEMAAELERDGGVGAGDLARVAEERRVEESGGTRVRVMTIHRSKGLEYDAVIVPMLHERPWGSKSGGYLTTREGSLGPIGRVARYPNETLRSVSPELREMHARQHRREVGEELCCLYVAMTRARRRLEIIVPADKHGRREEPEAAPAKEYALRPCHVIRGALAPEEPARPSRAGEEPTTLWELGDRARWSEGLKPAPAATERDVVELRVVGRKRRSAGRLAAASPSGSSGGVVRGFDVLGGDPGPRELGRLVHEWFELIDWLDEGEPAEEALRAAAERAGYGEGVIVDGLELWRAAMAARDVREAMSRAAWIESAGVERATALRERAFAVRRESDGVEALVRGRFDRLVVGFRDGRPAAAEVMDFKTDAGAAGLEGSALREHAERHRGQLEAYREAAARQLGLEAGRIAMTVLYVRGGGVARL